MGRRKRWATSGKKAAAKWDENRAHEVDTGGGKREDLPSRVSAMLARKPTLFDPRARVDGMRHADRSFALKVGRKKVGNEGREERNKLTLRKKKTRRRWREIEEEE